VERRFIKSLAVLEKIYMPKMLAILFLVTLLPVFSAYAETSCIDAVGEAAIINSDVASAKIEAIARAKWAAVEQAVGVEIKTQSIVQNMQMIDDTISKYRGAHGLRS